MEKIGAGMPYVGKIERLGGRSGKWKRLLLTCFGASLTAFALELLLTPNRIVTGGLQGISGLLAHMTEMQMGIFLLLLNVPFIVYGCNKKTSIEAFQGCATAIPL